MAILSSRKTIFSFIHKTSITLGAGEEVEKVADRASEGQAAGL